MSRKEKVYPSGIHVKFQRAVRISLHTRFKKPSTRRHNTLQQREIWRTPPSRDISHKSHVLAEKFCRKKKESARYFYLSSKKKVQNSRGSDEKMEQTWRLRNYKVEPCLWLRTPKDANIYEVEIFNDVLENSRVE